MPDDSIINNAEQSAGPRESETTALVGRIRKRFRESPAQVLFMGALALSLIVLVAYLLWPRQGKVSVTVETPPTLEGKRAAGGEGHEGGEEHDEHSQEGAIEVEDETAELIGIKTEKVASGEI